MWSSASRVFRANKAWVCTAFLEHLRLKRMGPLTFKRVGVCTAFLGELRPERVDDTLQRNLLEASR
eukprot:3813270-Rhodomonas_salina.1